MRQSEEVPLLHFSEDPGIEVFRPHVPQTNPTQPPMVWAMDAEHAPLYWFPRDCPRVTCWYGPDTDADRARAAIGDTTAHRVHAIEEAWLERMRATQLFAYAFDPTPFERWPEADGHWVTTQTVEPLDVRPIGDLVARHADAGIELRILPSLWPLHDAVLESTLCFSMVRMANARPR